MATIYNEIANLLSGLGVDNSFYIHLVIFIIAFTLIKVIIFDPYVAALNEREKRTVGGEELASELAKESETLQLRYEKKAREVNAKIREVYTEKETQARKETDAILATAREQSAAKMEQERIRIGQEIDSTRQQLKSQISEIAKSVTSQLIRG